MALRADSAPVAVGELQEDDVAAVPLDQGGPPLGTTVRLEGPVPLAPVGVHFTADS